MRPPPLPSEKAIARWWRSRFCTPMFGDGVDVSTPDDPSGEPLASKDTDGCPICGEAQQDEAAARRHVELEHGAARDSDDAGGTVPEGGRRRGDSSAGRVQTE
jgi:hypothetical protein